MKGLSPLHLILTILLVNTISANVVESDFICEQFIVPKDRINTAIDHACWALSASSSKTKYPAEFDPSATFSIHDAILFSWPVTIDGDYYFKGHAGKFRLLLDSSCKFFGMIAINENKPDVRCYQPVKAVRLYDLSLGSGPRSPTVIRGFRCQNEIFDSSYVDHNFKENLKLYNVWKYRKSNVHLNSNIAVNKLYQTTVYLLPSEIANTPNHNIENIRNPYFSVINPQFEMLGMVFRNINGWAKCEELHEIEPLTRQSLDINKNSIGETIFPVASGYHCGSHEFSRKSINSHMQLACNMMKRKAVYRSRGLIGDENYRISIPEAGVLLALSQSIKLPEALFKIKGYGIPNKAFVLFDEQCHYHGTFWYQQRRAVKCTQLST
ncbi:BgtE-4932 [Blumeria graminis f. sp. tritici]|uniref:BgtE-4932 n=1 Tax=Blumeria graminis f. sp. tritici TaxID=62690 RepID=A0A9X9QGH1_BLUGR|nr:BgtE-4932 [Blumeria graminis f. sp. tritici]